ncbi:hypothetical protein BN1723_003093 [Verticillium longisporum]|uniref:EF-hand domain-containing protein n=1 Tax=Verticillium longisporum TaxID=100787 RepID=A0A0G4LPT5_VERLO|nr:hypothetical protein BN1723_003093 [Verticillium longisporum]
MIFSIEGALNSHLDPGFASTLPPDSSSEAPAIGLFCPTHFITMPPSAVNFDIHQGRQDFQRLDQDWRANINESFNLIDTQDTGSLSAREWPIALNALGLQLPRSETYTLLCAHGSPPQDFDPHASASGGGSNACPPVRLRITRDTFETIAAWLITRRDPDEEAEAAWRLFDPRDTGRITVESLRTVCAEVNNMMTDQDLRKMIDTLDISGKGWVSKDEFMEMARGATKDRSH